MSKRQEIFESMKDSLLKKKTNNIYVIPWFSGQFIFSYGGVSGRSYYSDKKIKHECQLKVMKRWPDVFFAPGLRYDFGVVTGPSAFGCEVKFPENDSPVIADHPVSSRDDIKTLTVPDPYNDGLYPEALATLEYMLKNTEPDLIDNTGILHNTAYVLGPLEQAAQICGYDQFLIGMYNYPQIVHDLLKKTAENAVNWVKAQSTIVGEPQVLYVIDHLASMISAEQYQEFGLERLQEVFSEFDDCIKFYHNEGDVKHNLENIKNLGADIFHFDLSLEETKDRVGKEICLMGNINPLEVLKEGNPGLICEEAEKLIGLIEEDENFILSSGGGLAGHTPPENIDALIDTAKRLKNN